MRLRSAALVAVVLGAPVPGVAREAVPRLEATVPPTPAAVKDVLAVRRFTLETPYLYTWTSEPRRVATGVLVVLEVDRAYVVPREALEPVLYAGNVAVHRLNRRGDRSGRVIGIVPDDIDLATAPIWFGTPDQPGHVTPAMIQAERARAEKAGIRALPGPRVDAARRPAVAAQDLPALLRDVVAPLVEQYSPQDKDLADSWRLPVAKAPAKPR